MIGDDIFNDIEGAQLAGIKTILVRTGKYRDSLVKKSNITPDAIIPSINELESDKFKSLVSKNEKDQYENFFKKLSLQYTKILEEK